MNHRSLYVVGLLALVASCTLPFGSGTSTAEASITAPSDGAALVFHFKPQARAASYAYGVNDAGYLVVQLSSGSQSRFATAAVSGGTASIAIAGIEPGLWELRTNLYDWDGVATGSAWSGSADPSNALLLYTGATSVAIQTATTSSVSVLLYKPGDIGQVTAKEASLVNSLVVQGLTSDAGVPIIQGDKRTLQAFAYSSNSTLADEQRVTWTSNDPSVAEVNAAGIVKTKKPGKVTITAESVEGAQSGVTHQATIDLQVEPVVYGFWKTAVLSSQGTSYLRIYRDGQNVLRWVSTLWVGGSWTPGKERGRVFADGEGWALVQEEYTEYGDPVPQWRTYGADGNYGVPSDYIHLSFLPTGQLKYEDYDAEETLQFGPAGTYVPVTSVSGSIDQTSVYLYTADNLTASATPAQASIPNVYWNSDSSSYSVTKQESITFSDTGVWHVQGYSLDDPSVTTSKLTVTVTYEP